jgi:hypothetical protein
MEFLCNKFFEFIVVEKFCRSRGRQACKLMSLQFMFLSILAGLSHFVFGLV